MLGYGRSWPYNAVNGRISPNTGVHGRICLYMAVNVRILLYMVVHGSKCPNMAKYGCVRPYMPNIDEHGCAWP